MEGIAKDRLLHMQPCVFTVLLCIVKLVPNFTSEPSALKLREKIGAC